MPRDGMMTGAHEPATESQINFIYELHDELTSSELDEPQLTKIEFYDIIEKISGYRTTDKLTKSQASLIIKEALTYK